MATKASNGTVFRIFFKPVLVFSDILLFDHHQKLKFTLIYIIRPKSKFFVVPKQSKITEHPASCNCDVSPVSK